eukprot:jgi/Psemu1/314475/fgenesh1_kg.1542_\
MQQQHQPHGGIHSGFQDDDHNKGRKGGRGSNSGSSSNNNNNTHSHSLQQQFQGGPPNLGGQQSFLQGGQQGIDSAPSSAGGWSNQAGAGGWSGSAAQTGGWQ